MAIRVLLVEDDEAVRRTMVRVLAGTDGIEVIGVAGDGREAIEKASILLPDIVLMDVGLPDLNGIVATCKLRAAGLSCQVIALSAHSSIDFLAGMFAAGARGYLVKGAARDDLALAVRTVVAGHRYLAPALLDQLIDDYVQRVANDGALPAGLTPREAEVLQLIAEGHANAAIAAQLGLSARTVEHHRIALMQRTDTRTVAALTRYAIKHGLSPA